MSAAISARSRRVIAPSCRFSSTVSRTKVPRPSGTWATPSRTMSSVAQPEMRLPSKRMSPPVRTMPHSARSTVVLPAPLAPSRVRIMPLVEAETDAVQRLVLAVQGVEPLDLEHHGRGSSRPGAEIGADHLFVLLHLGRRALGDLAAEIERDDLVRDRHHQVHVMLDQQHGDLPLVAHPADQGAELADLLVVEPAGRLVEQQQLRLRGEGAGQFDPLAGAERQPGRGPDTRHLRGRAAAAATRRFRSAPPPAAAPRAGAARR